MHASNFFLRLSLLGAICCLIEAKQPHRKVLILGAGLSGIVAGKTLKDNGVDDFLVLEGQDYIGGRIKQVPFSGMKVEEGANFIHSVEDAATFPIWRLKILNVVKGMLQSIPLVIRNESGAHITDMSDLRKLGKAMALIEKTQSEREKENKPAISAREGLALLGWKPTTPLQYAVEWYVFDFDYGKRVELIPFSSLGSSDDVDFLVADQRGMMELYRDLYKGFENKININKTVVGIKYNSSMVEVMLSNGEVYTADYVLCTFSSGVLASDMVKFSPPFPQWKTKAISDKPLGAFTKIFVKFPKRFWENKDYIIIACKKRGYYPVIQNLDMQGVFLGSGLMMLVVTGNEARRIEKQSFNDTKAEIVMLLRGIYGNNYTEPTGIHYARWTQNPYVRGSYSEGKVGYSASKNHADMMKNLGRLYFSGEAASEEWYGYMQGAYWTGEKQAKTIAKAIKCNNDKNCPMSGSASIKPAISILLVTMLWCIYHW